MLRNSSFSWSTCRYRVRKDLCQDGGIRQDAGEPAGERTMHIVQLVPRIAGAPTGTHLSVLFRSSCPSARPTWRRSRTTSSTASWFFRPQPSSKATSSCRCKREFRQWKNKTIKNKKARKAVVQVFICWRFSSSCLSQPLLTRKNELDRLRKEVKEQWQREQKKMVGCFCRRPHTSACTTELY